MIWLTWRQHRGEALVVAGILVLFTALMLSTGLAEAHTFQQLGVSACLSPSATNPNCDTSIEAFRQQYGSWPSYLTWFNLAPLLLAMLVGAPVVARELEHGTQRLVWTQSVTRLRWIAVKLAWILGAGLLLAALLTVLLTWWRSPWDQLDGRFVSAGYDFEGLVPFAYVTFALALAIAAGALLRRTIPAMAATLAGFLAVRLPIEAAGRARFQAPHALTWDPALSNPVLHQARGDWDIYAGWVDRLGHTVDFNQVYQTCANNQAHIDLQPDTPFTLCTHAHGWLYAITWQPADRFWFFQGIESAIFLGVAAALLALTIWWVRRRLA